MPSNTDDEIYRDLARLLEHMLRSLPSPEPGQVVGFTVMTGALPVDPEAWSYSDDDSIEIDYECVEGHDALVELVDDDLGGGEERGIDLVEVEVRLLEDLVEGLAVAFGLVRWEPVE